MRRSDYIPKGIILRATFALIVLSSLALLGCNQQAGGKSASSPPLQHSLPPEFSASQTTAPPTAGEGRANPEVKAVLQIGHEYDISRRVELREGPSDSYPKKINQKASDFFKTVQYLSVDPSTSVRVEEVKDGWAEIQVTQPASLAASHRGWIPIDCIQGGAASNKLDGWIRHTCLVYMGKSKSSKTAGYLAPPSAVNVSDDGSGWLRLIEGPIMIEGSTRFMEKPDFEKGLYIESGNFTTVVPGSWNK